MRMCTRLLLLSMFAFACQKGEENRKSQDQAHALGANGTPAAARSTKEQVKPPFDLKTPPAGATKTASGLVYKKITTNDAAPAPKRNDTVMVNYTGWRPATGETFFTNHSRGQPMPLNLANTAPGFVEAMQLLKKGEKAMLWVPANIGYKGEPSGTPEALVYEVEVVDIHPAPAIPSDVATPPAQAATTKSGVRYVVIRPGTGTAKVRSFDKVTYRFTGWDAEGRMYETTEMKDRPITMAPYQLPAALDEVLTTMTSGQRVRFWTTAEKLAPNGKPAPGMPQGPVCGELEIISTEKGIEPPAAPADVGKPPGDAKKSAKGVFYKVLKAGKGGPKPKPSDTVRVNYTGWTTDGRMFDSSVLRNQPAEFSLQAVVAGWTEGIPLMAVGDKFRFWIPEELAYKGAPGRPQGMLVFDVELLDIVSGVSPDNDHPSSPHPSHP